MLLYQAEKLHVRAPFSLAITMHLIMAPGVFRKIMSQNFVHPRCALASLVREIKIWREIKICHEKKKGVVTNELLDRGRVLVANSRPLPGQRRSPTFATLLGSAPLGTPLPLQIWKTDTKICNVFSIMNILGIHLALEIS